MAPSERFARRWSDILNPLYLSPPLFVISGWLAGSDGFSLATAFGISLTSLTFAPLMYLTVLTRQGRIEGFDVLNRTDRPGIYLFGLSCYLAAIALLWMADIAPKSHYLFICLVYFINTLIFFGINRFTKISVHSASIATVGTLITTFIPLGQPMMLMSAVLLFSIMTGVMIWSRVVLQCHTLGQAISGATLGSLLPLIERYLIYPMLV
jgi:hypothetical protein